MGYPKTGTTYLQTDIFPAARGYRVVSSRERYSAWCTHLTRAHPLDFDPTVVRNGLQLDAPDAMPVLWSAEHLLGDALTGAHDTVALADRLASVAPALRIIVTIRSQRPLLSSLYRQYVHEGGVRSMGELLDADVSQHVRIEAAYLDFDAVIGVYEERFGHDNVLVLPQERLAKTPAEATVLLESFLGSRLSVASVDDAGATMRNAGTSIAAYRLLRVANRVFGSRFSSGPARRLRGTVTPQRAVRRILQGRVGASLTRLGPAVDPLAEVPAEWWDRHLGRFASGNKRLSSRFDLGLETLGYPWP